MKLKFILFLSMFFATGIFQYSYGATIADNLVAIKNFKDDMRTKFNNLMVRSDYEISDDVSWNNLANFGLNICINNGDLSEESEEPVTGNIQYVNRLSVGKSKMINNVNYFNSFGTQKKLTATASLQNILDAVPKSCKVLSTYEKVINAGLANQFLSMAQVQELFPETHDKDWNLIFIGGSFSGAESYVQCNIENGLTAAQTVYNRVAARGIAGLGTDFDANNASTTFNANTNGGARYLNPGIYLFKAGMSSINFERLTYTGAPHDNVGIIVFDHPVGVIYAGCRFPRPDMNDVERSMFFFDMDNAPFKNVSFAMWSAEPYSYNISYPYTQFKISPDPEITPDTWGFWGAFAYKMVGDMSGVNFKVHNYGHLLINSSQYMQ